MIYFALTLCTAGAYLFLQIFLAITWKRLPEVENYSEEDFTEKITIMLAARNEERHIGSCLQSLLRQSYPSHLVEIFVLDNHSSDGTIRQAASLQDDRIKIFSLGDYLPEETTFKKNALAFGISRSHAEWIITIDADCIAPIDWLVQMLGHARSMEADMVLGPVLISPATTYLERYQALEVAGLNLATSAGLLRGWLLNANGANLAFRRTSYEKVGGYEGSYGRASGDDVFLLHKFHADRSLRICSLKDMDAAIYTKPESTYVDFFQQRKRWAAKAGDYMHVPTKVVSVLLLANSCLLLLHLLLIPLFGGAPLFIFLIHFVLKVVADIIILTPTQRFFGIKMRWTEWIFAILFNPLSIILVALTMLWSNQYIWKGRQVR